MDDQHKRQMETAINGLEATVVRLSEAAHDVGAFNNKHQIARLAHELHSIAGTLRKILESENKA